MSIQRPRASSETERSAWILHPVPGIELKRWQLHDFLLKHSACFAVVPESGDPFPEGQLERAGHAVPLFPDRDLRRAVPGSRRHRPFPRGR